ncbi:MAG: methyltransferase domain-containing protein [Myxococcales bacterium]|nr:methyltransferase domain-containing protein [Myxococcales bacterium]
MNEAIQARYGELAESECCLSCGSAVSACDPRPGEVCVDLGSGRGTDVLRLAEAVGPDGHAYGVDVTSGMLAAARKTAAKLGVANATFLEATFDRIPLPEGSVDWVVSNCALNHAPDKAAVWGEIARILRPGGRFVVSDIYAVEPIPAEHRDDPEAVAECWAGAVPKIEYLAHIALAGLGAVRILEESAPYAKGKARVASFTVAGQRPKRSCCCQG